MDRLSGQAKLLSLVDILEPLSKEELEELAARCPDVRLEEGQSFYRPPEHDGGLFLIKEGRVRIYKLSPQGDQFTFGLMSSGTVLTAGRLRGLHAQAMEPSVIAFMSRDNLEYVIRRKPEVGLRLIDLLAERLRLMDERMFDVVHKEVRARLAGLILQLLHSEGVVTREGGEISRRYTHEELGAMIGAKRVAVTRAFHGIRKTRAVELKQRRILVRDEKALERIARGED